MADRNLTKCRTTYSRREFYNIHPGATSDTYFTATLEVGFISVVTGYFIYGTDYSNGFEQQGF